MTYLKQKLTNLGNLSVHFNMQIAFLYTIFIIHYILVAILTLNMIDKPAYEVLTNKQNIAKILP